MRFAVGFAAGLLVALLVWREYRQREAHRASAETIRALYDALRDAQGRGDGGR